MMSSVGTTVNSQNRESLAEVANSPLASRVRVELVLAILAVAITTTFAAWHLSSWPARLRYGAELDSVEGRVLADMVQLREGAPIYAPTSPERFDSANYGPLFYLLGSRLIDPGKPNYFDLRLLSALATLGLAASCALLAFWLARSYLAAAAGAMLFLTYGFVTSYGTFARSDTPALLLWFSGFLVAYRFRNGRKILLAVPLMALAFYFKQQFVTAPLAVLLFLLLERRFRLAAEFAALLGLAGAGLLAVFEFLIFRHQSFLLHFLTYNLIPYNWLHGRYMIVGLAFVLLPPSVVAAQFLRTHPNKLLSCYFGWAIVLLLLALAKEGSGLNYAFELVVIVCPLLGAFVGMGISRLHAALMFLFLLGLTVCTAQFPDWRDWRPGSADVAEDQHLQAYLRENFAPHTAALGYVSGDLLRAGLDTPISDLYQYGWLVCKGTLGDQALLEQIGEHRFGVILLTSSRGFAPENTCFTEPLRQAVTQNYRLTASFPTYFGDDYVWVPR